MTRSNCTSHGSLATRGIIARLALIAVITLAACKARPQEPDRELERRLTDLCQSLGFQYELLKTTKFDNPDVHTKQRRDWPVMRDHLVHLIYGCVPPEHVEGCLSIRAPFFYGDPGYDDYLQLIVPAIRFGKSCDVSGAEVSREEGSER
jgi:hypothetical protein